MKAPKMSAPPARCMLVLRVVTPVRTRDSLRGSSGRRSRVSVKFGTYSPSWGTPLAAVSSRADGFPAGTACDVRLQRFPPGAGAGRAGGAPQPRCARGDADRLGQVALLRPA